MAARASGSSQSAVGSRQPASSNCELRTANSAPVIAIDGPSASGKGTVAALAAERLGFHYLDSGAIYRATAHAARRAGVDLDDEASLVRLAEGLELRFDTTGVYLSDRPVGEVIRSEAVGRDASRIAGHPALRTALLGLQRGFRKSPGLVADGRDMGSVVFPDAALKVFLTADVEERAQRRYKQLIEKGFDVNVRDLLQDLRERDARDADRATAPLQQATDARLLDTTGMTIDEAANAVIGWYREVASTKFPKA
jgi:cytidylate kinase